MPGPLWSQTSTYIVSPCSARYAVQLKTAVSVKGTWLVNGANELWQRRMRGTITHATRIATTRQFPVALLTTAYCKGKDRAICDDELAPRESRVKSHRQVQNIHYPESG